MSYYCTLIRSIQKLMFTNNWRASKTLLGVNNGNQPFLEYRVASGNGYKNELQGWQHFCLELSSLTMAIRIVSKLSLRYIHSTV